MCQTGTTYTMPSYPPKTDRLIQLLQVKGALGSMPERTVDEEALHSKVLEAITKVLFE